MTAAQLTELRKMSADNPTIAAAVALIDSLPKWADGEPFIPPCNAWYTTTAAVWPTFIKSIDAFKAYGCTPLYRTESDARAAMEAAR